MDAPLSRRRAPSRPAIRRFDESDPTWKSVELVQRGRMILDVATADLEVAEAVHGAFHPTSWHFRNTLAEARRSWDRLRAEFGGPALEAALAAPPLTTLTIGETDAPRAVFIPIAGKTYRVEQIPGTELAPIQWRITPLPRPKDGPYYACRLQDGSTQCDCAEWTYRIAEVDHRIHCKHLAALENLGWL
jgi:hypothetical protein